MRKAQAWLDDAVSAYEASTTFVDTNYRKKWEYGIRAFQNEHAPGSKYLSAEYQGRSRIFRPRTRSIIRKNEAAAALTVGNLDTVEVGPQNPDDQTNLIAAEALKHVLKYRLSNSIPWFQTVVGAMQDAQVQGAVCSYNYWEYETKPVGDAFKVLKDKPCIDLRPLENIRIDPGAKWTDPVNSSPYFIDLIPMYVCDIEALMGTEDRTTGKPVFKPLPREEIAKATEFATDSTRKIRQGTGAKDAYQDERPITSHSIVWVLRYFMRDGADDFTFYTLGNHTMLTEARPIEEVYFHGVRPYTMGCCILETHRPIPDSPAWLARHLQLESNDIANQRLDNVKLVLNKRYIVGRGRQVDITSLLRNVPGSVTLATNPREDVMPMEWGDVTSSSYMEQDRISADFDDLVGNFSPFTKFSGSGVDETLGRAKLAQTGASAMTEYAIQTLTETYFEPTLKQLMLLEQYYETDETVLAIAAKNAKLFPRYGYSRITDDLISRGAVVKVNIGVGATDPQTRLQKFIMAITAAFQAIQNSPPGVNIQEVIKEIFRNAGFRDGDRFFGTQFQDPRLIKAMEMIKGLQSEVQSKRYEIDTKAQTERMRIMADTKIKADEIKVNAARIDADSMLREQDTQVQARSVEIDLLDTLLKHGATEGEIPIRQLESALKVQESEERIKSEQSRRQMEELKAATDVEKTKLETALMAREAQAGEEDRNKVAAATQAVGMSLQTINSAVEEIRADVQNAGKTAQQMQALQDALAQLAQAMSQVAQQVDGATKKAVPVTYRKKRKPDGKLELEVMMSDGQARVMSEVD